MRLLLDAVYLILLIALSPYLLYQYVRGKVRHGLFAKLRGDAVVRRGEAPCAWFHAVSMGEVLLLRTVVARFRQRHPNWDVVLSTTTRTGFDEANKRFPDVPVVWWPLDFSWAVGRALDRVRPDLVVLAECELWPNFVRAAQRRGVRVAVINGRMSPRSAARWRWAAFLVRGMFRSIDLFAVQTEEYAEGVRALGVPAERVHVTGSMKYDGAITDRNNPRTRDLGELPEGSWRRSGLIAGSTQTPEERGAGRLPGCEDRTPEPAAVPGAAQPERFDEVAALARAGLECRSSAARHH
jgi:3-deoxy-D-manno-octulosonic-acid transferase